MLTSKEEEGMGERRWQVVGFGGIWKGKELESFLSNTAHASHFPAISPIPFLFPTLISSASDLCKVGNLATHLMFYKCVLFKNKKKTLTLS